MPDFCGRIDPLEEIIYPVPPDPGRNRKLAFGDISQSLIFSFRDFFQKNILK
jgi:hypothetical protein